MPSDAVDWEAMGGVGTAETVCFACGVTLKPSSWVGALFSMALTMSGVLDLAGVATGAAAFGTSSCLTTRACSAAG